MLIIVFYRRQVSITGEVRAVSAMLLLLRLGPAESSRLRFWSPKVLFELSLLEIRAQVRDIEAVISLSLPLALRF